MKFRRNVGLYRGSLDAAPLATVFFLLVILMVLASRIYTPGVHINLPVAGDVSGTDKPMFTVALDSAGRLYFENQVIEREALKKRLMAAAKTTPDLVLQVLADKGVTDEKKDALYSLARAAGIREAWEARLPQQSPMPRGVE
jgi:biopolymer transport protein ExbD